MAGQWIVLVEAAGAGGCGGVAPGDVSRLLAAVSRTSGSDGGGALESPDRYALQLTTTAPGPAEALLRVLASWVDALRELDLPIWQVVRTEVLTPEELERDENRLRNDLPTVAVAGRGERPRNHCSRRPTSPRRLS